MNTIKTMNEMMKLAESKLGGTHKPPVTILAKQTSTVTESKQVKLTLCELMQIADKTIDTISNLPNVPTACMNGLSNACDKQFLRNVTDLLRKNHVELNQLKCELATLEQIQENLLKSVEDCSKSLKSNLKKCDEENTCPAVGGTCGSGGKGCGGGGSPGVGGGGAKKKSKYCNKDKPKKDSGTDPIPDHVDSYRHSFFDHNPDDLDSPWHNPNYKRSQKNKCDNPNKKKKEKRDKRDMERDDNPRTMYLNGDWRLNNIEFAIPTVRSEEPEPDVVNSYFTFNL